MGKIKFTKGELKRQRDALKQYERFLPTLQLKKQQLQLEIMRQMHFLDEKKKNLLLREENAFSWAGLLSDNSIEIKKFIGLNKIIRTTKNIAGVQLPVFERVDFASVEYDLFLMPLWLDLAVDALQQLIWLKEEIRTVEESVVTLRQELRITTQRVNLFEKVKIPEAEEAIRLIKIYIGDQMANAVGRSKAAKRKIEAMEFAGALL